jgi:uroporphyrinogen-III decarboxylase
VDFTEHNEEVKAVWESYRAGKPTRVPFILGINPRLTMINHSANPKNITFEQYFHNADLMIERQIEHSHWVRHNLPHDVEMGLPDAWGVYVDFQNVYESAWFGCEVEFPKDQVPVTEPIITDDNRNLLFDRGIPDPFTGGCQKHAWELWATMKEREKAGVTFYDRPIRVGGVPGFGTDGPMTNCCNLRGAAEFCLELAMDPDYACQLLDFVTGATIARIKAYRERMGYPEKEQSFGFADDSIALLSPSMYEEMILPRHRRLMEAFSKGGPNSIHLCGDATRHFPMLKRELNIQSFDTGFPVDFTWLRRELGPETEILGGPSVPFLQNATPQETLDESNRILQSGIMEGGKFILREGNNLSPEITAENVAAMYEAAKTTGRY